MYTSIIIKLSVNTLFKKTKVLLKAQEGNCSSKTSYLNSWPLSRSQDSLIWDFMFLLRDERTLTFSFHYLPIASKSSV